MALTLPVPSFSYAEQSVTLGGLDYSLIYTYNDRDKRWRVSVYQDEVAVIVGLKIMENQLLLTNYSLDAFDHGDIACTRVLSDGKDVGRNNLGIDKPYELIYLTNSEIETLING